MEQTDLLFEFKLGSEKYRFEAPSLIEAEKYRPIALDFFYNKATLNLSEAELEGPTPVKLPEGFHVLPASNS